jgi:hypothetical protein
MLSEEQLVDRLRSELAPLRPRADLAERVREQAQTHAGPLGRACRGRVGRFRLRPARLAAAGGLLVVLAVGLVVLVLAGSTASRRPAPVGGSTRRDASSAVASARPGRGPVTCLGNVCHQGRRLVRDPAGSTCGHGSWVAKTTVPETTYGCQQRSMMGY